MEPPSKKARMDYACYICGQRFAHKTSLSRHKKSAHRSRKLTCQKCNATFTRRDNYLCHMKKHVQVGGANPDTQTTDDPCLKEKALNGTMAIYDIPAKTTAMFDPMTFLKYLYNDVTKRLEESLLRGGIKWYLSLQVRFSKRKGDTMEKVEPHFRGKCHVTLKTEDIGEAMRESFKKIYMSFIDYQRQGSNWTLDKVLGIKIHVARYRPLKGSSYIPLPMKLRLKHAIINVQNRDNKCFLWSVLTALHPTKRDAERVSKYKDHVTELDLTGISFPVKMADIQRFENQNKISINVFGFEKSDVFPIHVTKQRYDNHVNLLLISDLKKSHYCWVKNVDRLLSDQHTHKTQYFHCIYCLQGFAKKRILNDHMQYCREHGTQKVDLPKEEDKWLFYKDFRKQMKVPYIYADFESFQVPISGCSKEPNASYTEKTTQHVPSSFAYKVVGLVQQTSKTPVVYRGPDVADKFIECMVREQDEIEQRFKHVEPLVMTGKDWQSFKGATKCHICKKDLWKERVRDHCHVTGQFRGAAHNECNINYKYTGRIPVAFHNLRGYDSHLIMQAIGKIQNKEIKCIPNNMEKYISFSLGCMDFIDSYQFLPTSLEKLMKNLAKEEVAKFKHMTQHFGNDHIDPLLQKQVYPYDYFDGPQRFQEKELPPHEAFHSSLTGEGVTQEAYEHAKLVWENFEIQDLGQYSDLYVLTDVLGLQV